MNASPRNRAALALGSLLIAILPCPSSAAAPNSAATASSAAAPTPPCEACHGAHGEGMAAAQVPRLAGQSADYLQKQLDDYARGTRDNPIMRNFAKALSEQQRAQFAARFAAMSAPYIAPSTPLSAVTLARGHQLAFQGDESRRVAACNSCHGPDGAGVLYAAPYLAGQSAEYLGGALKAFQQGTRKNDAGQLMRSVAERLDDADITAAAGYFANLESSTH
jgi:cytochrome c553